MIKKMHSLPLLSLLLCFFFCKSCFAVSNNEASALLSVRAGLIDPLDRLRDWKVLEHHCNWTGVQCSSNGAVEMLDLSRMNLSGVISDDLQNLRRLKSLNLCGNGFSSPLPKSLGNLTELVAIDVSLNNFVDGFPAGLGRAAGLVTVNASSNNFSGSLPQDFANLTSLESLDLRGNFFEGLIPKSYKNLGKLRFLGLSGNNLSGLIPGELGELSALETIVIGYNAFIGGIPPEFGNLTNLRYLDLAFGNVGGRIPDQLGKLEMLETVYLFNNNFEGGIPPSIGNITTLLFLDLSYNMLTGEIPSEIANLKNLELLNLMCNKLSGSVPEGLQEMTQLSVISLWNNTLSGHLPGDLGRHSPLQWLDVSSNSLSGDIPEGLCSKGNLTKLILFNNGFSGQIPTALSACTPLVRVRIQNNLLSGTIPVGLGKLESLQRLEIANNSLTGQIPSDLSSSVSLSFIDFSKNKLQSSLPFSITSMTNLQSFIVSDNNLAGNIPDQFQDCTSLSVLDLSKNHFTGKIPASIASCEKLVTLNLNGNQLTGEIPTEIAKMPTLSVLNLSNNSLTGEIPESFGNSPALETLNLSNNNLSGTVPSNGMLKSIIPDDLTGNAALCGGVLPPCHHGGAAAYTSKQGLHAKHIVFGWLLGTGTLLVLVVAGLAGRTLYQKWYEGDCFRQKFSVYSSSKDWPWRLMAFQRLGFNSSDLLACLKESNVVGMGATGVVYKAEMPRQNAIVAVKKLWRTDVEMGTRSRDDDLVGEVNLLGKLRHRNIVRLLGFLHNENDAMIVYEFMENGSLGDALHGKQLLVDWVSRYNIAVGVAQGLAYLHHDCHPPVIHRDVKSNNILLDANLDARIADFGLAKMMIRKNETVSMVAGSYGYIAPEYGYTLKVDEKSDIYSYGVVLMELLSGRRPLDPEFGDSVDIVEWIRTKIRQNKPLETTLDPSVGGIRHVQEEMLLVLRIAILCTARLPKDRPSMRDVITMLGEAKPRRKGSSSNVDSDATSNNTNPIFTTSPVNDIL